MLQSTNGLEARPKTAGTTDGRTEVANLPGGAFIEGQWQRADLTTEVRDPEDNVLLGRVCRSTTADVRRAIAHIHRHLQPHEWPLRLGREALERAARLLTEQGERFATIIASESSKTITEAEREVKRCIETLRLSAAASTGLAGETLGFEDSMAGAGKIGWYKQRHDCLRRRRRPSAAKAIVAGAFGVARQNCLSVQRVYVHISHFDVVLEHVARGTKALKAGRKLDLGTDVGPLISEAEARRVEEWVEEAKAAGATVHARGQRRNAYYEPTVLADVPSNCRVIREEVFWPVVSILPFIEGRDAVYAANSSDYGPQVGVFTQSIDQALDIAAKLHVEP